MSMVVPNRTIANTGVFWRAHRWSAGNTTEGWQDKGPRGATVIGCVFSRAYEAFLRGARNLRTSPFHRFPRDFMGLTRCAGFLP